MRRVYGNEFINSGSKIVPLHTLEAYRRSTHSYPRHCMGGDCQPYAAIALTHGKHPLLVVYVETGLAPQPV